MLNGCCTRLKIIEFFNKEKLNNCKSLIYKIEKRAFSKNTKNTSDLLILK